MMLVELNKNSFSVAIGLLVSNVQAVYAFFLLKVAVYLSFKYIYIARLTEIKYYSQASETFSGLTKCPFYLRSGLQV